MNDQPIVLVIDDEPDICELLTITLSRMGLHTDIAAGYQEAIDKLKTNHYDLCLTDMRLPDGNGLDLVKLIQQQHSKMPVAVISAHGNMEAAVTALKSGAFDFISKPIDLNNLRSIIASALNLSKQNKHKTVTTDDSASDKLLGNSKAIQTLRKTIHKLARSQAPVYIHGESGTGKELVAQLIHQLGPRKNGPFIPVNCSAIPSELMESEFFGHKKGSFTGAHSDKQGLFQAADGGTLFFDEVADLPIGMQVKLLRAIQERRIKPIGSTTEIPIDIRILSATHKDLNELLKNNQFREDFYYRINVIRLDIPPLRERTDDILLLADHFIQQITASYEIPILELAESAKEKLCQYAFPGNIRELENILEHAIALCESDIINADNLQLSKSKAQSKSQNPNATSQTDSLDDLLNHTEKASIENALAQTHWNKTEAAKLLGISFRQLRYRIKKLGIE